MILFIAIQKFCGAEREKNKSSSSRLNGKWGFFQLCRTYGHSVRLFPYAGIIRIRLMGMISAFCDEAGSFFTEISSRKITASKKAQPLRHPFFEICCKNSLYVSDKQTKVKKYKKLLHNKWGNSLL